MYTGNGAAKEFPLPEGADGSEVWLTPPGGDAVRMEEGAAYTVTNGAGLPNAASSMSSREQGSLAVFFVIPPPEGWTVSFEKPTDAEPMTGGYVVVYADGTMRTVSGDPAEMLEQAQTMLTAAKAEREALVKTIAAKAVEISVAAEGAKAVMTARLLNNSALAEKAIEAAAAAVKQDVLKETAEAFEELRDGQKKILIAQEEIRAARKAVLDAVQGSAEKAAKEAKSEVHDCCKEALEAYERIRALKVEMEELAATARNAAADAGREATQSLTTQGNVLLEEIRSVRARLERDVIQETDREERRRNEALEDMRRIRDETAVLARAAARMEGRAQNAADRAAEMSTTGKERGPRRAGTRRAKEEKENG